VRTTEKPASSFGTGLVAGLAGRAAATVSSSLEARNTRDPRKASLACTEDRTWRNRGAFVTGREEIVKLLPHKWERELGCTMRRELWAFGGNRIAVRFGYEGRDRAGQWWRGFGNELWELDGDGLMCRHAASISGVPVGEHERRIFGPRPQSGRQDLPVR
jgi:uncharacterized protein